MKSPGSERQSQTNPKGEYMMSIDFAGARRRILDHAGLTIRVAVLAVLTLVLLVPLSMIDGLIAERSIRRGGVEAEIAALWGGAQRLGGPVLTVPYVTRRTEIRSNGTAVDLEGRRYVHVLPFKLDARADMAAERRYRSIYDVLVYGVEVELSGKFILPGFGEWDIDAKDVRWNEAILAVGIADMHGVRAASFGIDGRSLAVTPDVQKSALFKTGLASRPFESAPTAAGREHSFKITLTLNGSGALRLLPFGNESKIAMAANWPHPNFIGASLPSNRDIGDDGFTAEWLLSYLARPYPSSWRAEDLTFELLPESSVGVELVLPGDGYQQTDRIVKYGVMVIGLTFATIFVVGLLRADRAHFVQYLLVGASICLFYLLALSLSEHIRFVYAYVLASVVNIATVALYVARTVGRRCGVIVTVAMVVIHGWMFILLQMEDYVLLAGSIGLLAALVMVMSATRNVDWFAVRAGESSRPAPTT
jgi:inner membrane protein